MTERPTSTIGETLLKAIGLAIVTLFVGLILSLFFIQPAKGQSWGPDAERARLQADRDRVERQGLAFRQWNAVPYTPLPPRTCLWNCPGERPDHPQPFYVQPLDGSPGQFGSVGPGGLILTIPAAPAEPRGRR